MKYFFLLSLFSSHAMAGGVWTPEVCAKACAIHDMRCYKVEISPLLLNPFLNLLEQKSEGFCNRKTDYYNDTFQNIGEACLRQNKDLKIDFPRILSGAFTQDGKIITFQEKRWPVWRSKAGGDNELKGDILQARVIEGNLILTSNNLYISCIQGSL